MRQVKDQIQYHKKRGREESYKRHLGQRGAPCFFQESQNGRIYLTGESDIV